MNRSAQARIIKLCGILVVPAIALTLMGALLGASIRDRADIAASELRQVEAAERQAEALERIADLLQGKHLQ